jgi:hypothetical protein
VVVWSAAERVREGNVVVQYSEQIERAMKTFYESLSEKDRWRYAAVEAAKLGHGGTDYIATVLGCDPKTIRQGQRDLEALPPETWERIRRKGGAANGV